MLDVLGQRALPAAYALEAPSGLHEVVVTRYSPTVGPSGTFDKQAAE